MSKETSRVIHIFLALAILLAAIGFSPVQAESSNKNIPSFPDPLIEPGRVVALSPLATPVDVVFSIDNTGSMGGTINQVKTDAQYIMDQIRASFADSYFGAIKFKDYGDDYVVSIATNLTSDTASVKSGINGMAASGGGDTPEAYIDMVQTAVNQINWRTSSVKLLVVLGDAPPHDPAYGTGTHPSGVRWADVASLAANRGIRVSMVSVGSGVGDTTVQQSYQYMASATSGIFREAPSSSQLAADLIALINNFGSTPLVTAVSPLNGATSVAVGTNITATFSVPVLTSSLNSSTVILSSSSGVKVAGAITYNSSTNQVTFNPTSDLLPNMTYTATLTSGIVSASNSRNPLALYRWSFTTAGSPRAKVADAMNRLRMEIKDLIDYNASQAADILGRTRAKTHTSDLRMLADWALWALGLVTVQPSGVSDAAQTALQSLWAARTLILFGNTANWVSRKFDGAPWEAVAARDYFYNELQNSLELTDERADGSVKYSAIGFNALKASIDQSYADTVAALPATISEADADAAVGLIDDIISKISLARIFEQFVPFWDMEAMMCGGDQYIGTVATQKAQFEDMLKHYDVTKTVNDTITTARLATGAVKIASAACILASAGTATPVCGVVFAKSEIVFWIEGAVSTVPTIVNLTTKEKTVDLAFKSLVAATAENIQLRRLFNGTAWRVHSDVSADLPADKVAPQAPAANPADFIQVLSYSMNNLTIPTGGTYGTAPGVIQVRNNGTSPLKVIGNAIVVSNGLPTDADIVSLGRSEFTTVNPSATVSVPINVDIPASRLTSPSGYEARFYVLVLDEATNRLGRVGPFSTFFYVGDSSEVSAFNSALPSKIAGSALLNGEVAEYLYTPSTSKQYVRFTLAQMLGTGLDLHVYDQAGNHTGVNYTTGLVETGPGASYSGPNTQRESIDVLRSAGPFRVKVVAVDAGVGASFNVTTYEHQSEYATRYFYLPNVTRGDAFSGKVTSNNTPVSGLSIEMRYYNGSSYSTYATATTDASGAYHFLNTPDLSSGQSFYVRWVNPGNSNYLTAWVCDSVDSSNYATDKKCDFDIRDISLVSPAPGYSGSLPIEFRWTPRSQSTDSYEFNLRDMTNGTPWWWTYPALGYTDRYTLTSIPSGFSPGTTYGWYMWVYGPHGYGVSYYYRSITFASADLSPTTLEPLPVSDLDETRKLFVEDIEPFLPPR